MCVYTLLEKFKNVPWNFFAANVSVFSQLEFILEFTSNPPEKFRNFICEIQELFLKKPEAFHKNSVRIKNWRSLAGNESIIHWSNSKPANHYTMIFVLAQTKR